MCGDFINNLLCLQYKMSNDGFKNKRSEDVSYCNVGRFHLDTEGTGSGLTQGHLMCQGGGAGAEAKARASVGAAVEAKITPLN